jgi:hypothetical protein
VVIAFCALLVIWYIVGWQVNRRRGERLLEWVLQGLRASPRGEVEVMKKRGRLAGRVLKGLDEGVWVRQETAGGLVMACRGEKGHQQADAISHLVEDLSPRLLRLSLSKKAPHLLVNLSLAGMDEQSALLLFASLQELAQTATSRDH